MALRAIEVMKGVAADIEAVCPAGERLQLHEPGQHRRPGLDDEHRTIPLVSLCEGPIIFTEELAEAAGLDPARVYLDDGGAQPRVLERRAPPTTART